jgi:flagellar biosynthetic protein FliO
MVTRRVLFSFLWTALIVALCAGNSPLVAQTDQKSSAFYVNAPPASATATPDARDLDAKTAVPLFAQSAPANPAPTSAASKKSEPEPQSLAAPATSDNIESHAVKKAQSSPQPPAEKAKAAPLTGSPLRMILALAAVLILIFLAAYFFRRLTLTPRGKRADRSVINILARNMIAPRQFVYLIKLGSRLLVVGVSPNHMTTLDAIDDPDEIARLTGSLEQNLPQSISSGFSRLFQRQADDYNTDRFDNHPEGRLESLDEPDPRQWSQARGELHSLLDKVKSLTRLSFRSSWR